MSHARRFCLLSPARCALHAFTLRRADSPPHAAEPERFGALGDCLDVPILYGTVELQGWFIEGRGGSARRRIGGFDAMDDRADRPRLWLAMHASARESLMP